MTTNLPARSLIALPDDSVWRKDIPLFREPCWVCGDQDLTDDEIAALAGVVLRVGA